jgi:hypothetical protein
MAGPLFGASGETTRHRPGHKGGCPGCGRFCPDCGIPGPGTGGSAGPGTGNGDLGHAIRCSRSRCGVRGSGFGRQSARIPDHPLPKATERATKCGGQVTGSAVPRNPSCLGDPAAWRLHPSRNHLQLKPFGRPRARASRGLRIAAPSLVGVVGVKRRACSLPKQCRVVRRVGGGSSLRGWGVAVFGAAGVGRGGTPVDQGIV